MSFVGAVVRVDDLSTAELDAGRLLAARIEVPAPGDEAAAYRVDLRGWAIGRDSAAVAIQLRHDGTLLRTIPLDVERPKAAAAHGLAPDTWIGFRASIGALRIATDAGNLPAAADHAARLAARVRDLAAVGRAR